MSDYLCDLISTILTLEMIAKLLIIAWFTRNLHLIIMQIKVQFRLSNFIFLFLLHIFHPDQL